MKKVITALILSVVMLLQPYAVIYAEEYNPYDFEGSVFAASNEVGNVPLNTIDGSLSTKWAAEGIGQWICYCLSEETVVKKIGFSFTSGDVRVYSFEVQASLDREDWVTVFNGESSGTTAGIEWFDLKSEKAKYIRFIGNGNSVNLWNNINEVQGLSLKKTPVLLSVDSKLQYYLDGPEEKDGTVYLPVCEVFDSLDMEYTWDKTNQLFTVSEDEESLTLNYRDNIALYNSSKLNLIHKLYLSDSGAPMIPYELMDKRFGVNAVRSEDGRNIEYNTERNAKIAAAYEKIDSEFKGVFDWLVSIYDPESGGFYNTVSGCLTEGYYPSLEASAYCYQIIQSLGADKAAPKEFIDKFSKFIQENQDPDTGLFVEKWPKALTYNTRDVMRVYDAVTGKLAALKIPTLYPLPSERNSQTSENTINIITGAESEPENIPDIEEANTSDSGSKEVKETTAKHEESTEDVQYDLDRMLVLPEGIPDYCASVNLFLKRVASHDWVYNTWGAGDKVYEDLSYILLLPEDVQKPYIDETIKWLNKQQNPRTAYWSSIDDIGFNAVSGAFKVARIYDRFGICPPNPELMANTIMQTLTSGHNATAACYVRNPISTLEILMRYNQNVHEMVMDYEPELLELYTNMMHTMFHSDGGASSAMYRSNAKFGGLVAGRVVCEGDVDGTLQMTIARTYLYTVFGRNVNKDYFKEDIENFWQRILAKEPVVKTNCRAKPGLLEEEDFSGINDVSELYEKNWAFHSFDTTIEKETEDGIENHYLLANDKISLNQDSFRHAFDRMYNGGEIELRLRVDRDLPFKTTGGNSLSYTYIAVTYDISNAMCINFLDYGTDKITIAFQNQKTGTSTYNHVATVNRNEWFDLKLKFTRESDGLLHLDCYINGKLYPAARDEMLMPEAEFIDGFQASTSTTRCSKIALDSYRITAY